MTSRADDTPIYAHTRGGRLVDLLEPDFSALDMAEDVARPLARIARFAGATKGDRPWSVAQHSVVGAEAALEASGDVNLALAFLVHDVHEIVIGDIPRPAARALAHYVGLGLRLTLGAPAAEAAEREAGGNLFAVALAGLCRSLDRAVHRRAGLPPQLPRGLADQVAAWDDRMLATEIADQLAPSRERARLRAAAWGRLCAIEPIRRRGPLKPWRETDAAERWLTRFDQWRIRPRAGQ